MERSQRLYKQLETLHLLRKLSERHKNPWYYHRSSRNYKVIFLKINLKFLRKQFYILFLLQSQPLGMSPYMPQSKRQEKLWEIFKVSLLLSLKEKKLKERRQKSSVFSSQWSRFLNPLYWISAFPEDWIQIFRMQKYKDVIKYICSFVSEAEHRQKVTL